MFIKIILAIVSVFFVLGPAAGTAQAQITYGDGYYVNLCGSGTAATTYTCDPGCNPATGRCAGTNNGVVKWTCAGKWEQCLESESTWSNVQETGNPGCGRTVQISMFDKTCRRQDGSWDNSCKLLGYMVWYSGDCWVGQGPSPTRSPSPTAGNITPTATPKVTPTTTPVSANTPTRTPTPVNGIGGLVSTPTPTVNPNTNLICGTDCSKGQSCPAGFSCIEGECRNPSCPADDTCFCTDGIAVAPKVPRTGVPMWVWGVTMTAVGVTGVKMRRTAKKIW